MGIPLSRQLTAFVYAIFTGALLGALYDFVRIWRVIFGLASYTRSGQKLYARPLPLIGTVRRAPSSAQKSAWKLVRLAFGDLLFAVSAGCVFSLFLYHAASGCFRWFYLFACAVGFFAYYFTVGKIVMLSSELLSFLLIAAVRYVICLLLLPLRAVRSLFLCMLSLLCKHILMPVFSAYRRRRRLTYTRRVRAGLTEHIRSMLDLQNS